MGRVVAVCLGRSHRFSKTASLGIRLLKGLGVEGDAHLGRQIKHVYDARRDPTRPNLRQVHLIHAELFDELHAKAFVVRPGDLGENVTTSGIDLLNLPLGARLRLGADAVLEVTGLRTPCIQIDRFQNGLMAAMLDRDADGRLIRKTGVMSIVIEGGDVRPGDAIAVEWPDKPYVPLEPV
jgi:MOSC domain-containing protein YiiM